MECVAHSVLDSGEVAVELLAAVVLADLLEQLGVVLAGPHPTVAASVDVSHVEHGHCAIDVVADLDDLLDRAPQILSARGLDTYQ